MTGIFFGSTTGNTEELAAQIAAKLGLTASDVHNVSNTPADRVDAYDCLLLGSSTWGLGELQDDWYDFAKALKTRKLSGKKVALFGCGDSSGYPDTFCAALGLIADELKETGCTFIGRLPATGYSATDSEAFADGMTLGLLCDDDEPGQTPQRLEAWIEALKNA